MPDPIYTEPRLAALYDALSPPGEDTRFYRALARTRRPQRILDLGCGTGQLASTLAADGHEVTAVDPAGAMLALARRKPLGDRVRWIEADACDLRLPQRFDLVVMTGHVFQVFLTDAAVRDALLTARVHLVPGGRLAFETRNPQVRAWATWTPEASRKRVRVPGIGLVDTHHELLAVEADRVRFATCYRFVETGDTLTVPSTLRFLPQEAVAAHLAATGFATVVWHGGWKGGPFRPESPEIIAVAR